VVQTTRKPMLSAFVPGEPGSCAVEVQWNAPDRHDPPRITGSRVSPVASSVLRSPHHSHTLPSVSCRPHAFGGSLPTGCVSGAGGATEQSVVRAKRPDGLSPASWCLSNAAPEVAASDGVAPIADSPVTHEADYRRHVFAACNPANCCIRPTGSTGLTM
jgi:hypothetical protein